MAEVRNCVFLMVDWTSRNRAIKRLFLQHAPMVSDIMVTLEIACLMSAADATTRNPGRPR